MHRVDCRVSGFAARSCEEICLHLCWSYVTSRSLLFPLFNAAIWLVVSNIRKQSRWLAQNQISPCYPGCHFIFVPPTLPRLWVSNANGCVAFFGGYVNEVLIKLLSNFIWNYCIWQVHWRIYWSWWTHTRKKNYAVCRIVSSATCPQGGPQAHLVVVVTVH